METKREIDREDMRFRVLRIEREKKRRIGDSRLWGWFLYSIDEREKVVWLRVGTCCEEKTERKYMDLG